MESKPQHECFNIVLVEPEIPPNTGSVARLCAATKTVLHLVHPLGFSVDDRHLKRAGLDYWQHVHIRHWESLAAFLTDNDMNKMHLLTKKQASGYTCRRYVSGDFLVFGKETKGLPESLLAAHPERCCSIPIFNTAVRSLNLAMAAGIVLYEAIRQNNGRAENNDATGSFFRFDDKKNP